MGVALRSSDKSTVALDATSASLPSGAVDYRILPLDELVVDVHRVGESPALADFGDSVFVDFALRSTQYRLAPGDTLGLNLPAEGEKEYVITVQPDGFVVLPRIGTSLSVAGMTLEEVTRLATVKYAKLMARPDIALSIVRSSGERVEKMSGKFEVSRDGTILVPSLGALDVLGRSSHDIGALLQQKAVEIYRNPIVVSVTVAEFTASDPSILATAETRRYFRETVKVSADGSVYVPMAGRLEAAGKSLPAFAALMTSALERKYQNRIDVNVALGGSSGMNIYVAGEVRAPGRQTYQPNTTMLQVLAAAGWINESGDLTRVTLIHRSAPGQYLVYTSNLQQVYQDASAAFQDLQLSPQDMIVVPRTGIADANAVVDMYIRRMLPFGTSVSYTYVNGRSTTVP